MHGVDVATGTWNVANAGWRGYFEIKARNGKILSHISNASHGTRRKLEKSKVKNEK